MSDQDYDDNVDDQPVDDDNVDDQPADDNDNYDDPPADDPPADDPPADNDNDNDDDDNKAPANYGGGGNVDLPASIGDACTELYSDNPSFNWFSCKLIDPTLKKGADMKIDKAGNGGLNELKVYLADEAANIIFFLLRVNTYDNENSSRCKFIYGKFIGTKVKFMAKAKLTPNLGSIADKFQVKHLSKDCDELMVEWTVAKLSKEFLRVGGAHKPSKYDYGPNAVYEVPKK